MTLFSKNSVGLVLSLLAVLVFSQVEMLHFMRDTILGRILLVALLLMIGYLNKFLGIVVVLIIIIMTNNSIEGFDSKDSKSKETKSKDKDSKETKSKDKHSKDKDSKDKTPTNPFKINTNTINQNLTKALQPLSQIQMQLSQAAEAASDESMPQIPTEQVSTESFSLFGQAKSEGPDVLEMENTLKRGKNSNTINVQYGAQNTDGVDPYDSFFGNFTAF